MSVCTRIVVNSKKHEVSSTRFALMRETNDTKEGKTRHHDENRNHDSHAFQNVKRL